MSGELLVPVDGKGIDWPRRVANAINALQASLAALQLRVDDKSGWANYRDSTAGQALVADTRAQWTNNAATIDDSEKPTDVATYWDAADNAVPGMAGDAVVLRIQSTFTPSDGTASMLTMDLDIGGGTLVDQQSIAITGGAGVPQRISFTSLGFQRDTWEANGAKVYVTADGPGDLTNKRILVARMHKANAGV
ncbi:hypothetical protein [Sphingomonas japonica]|uniref:Uncharacterized protein n=1 Tax=Sphingomonas japonica TaxID=511662 RepID=A0ABX0U2N5_9SPHN|nr:hypothetical protein [Sphingomonas japonica]NIJ24833.1 hypothetical protein [Sphingomonas japonica]